MRALRLALANSAVIGSILSAGKYQLTLSGPDSYAFIFRLYDFASAALATIWDLIGPRTLANIWSTIWSLVSDSVVCTTAGSPAESAWKYGAIAITSALLAALFHDSALSRNCVHAACPASTRTSRGLSAPYTCRKMLKISTERFA